GAGPGAPALPPRRAASLHPHRPAHGEAEPRPVIAHMDDLFDTPPAEAARRAPAGAGAPPRGPAPLPPRAAPPADRMRPRTLDEVVGQAHLIGAGKVLRRAFEEDKLHSMILWGPPGTGKTTLALLLAQVAGARFVTFSAVLSGVREIRQVMAEAQADRARRGRRTILFVDEIHRFNKAQQDAF